MFKFVLYSIIFQSQVGSYWKKNLLDKTVSVGHISDALYNRMRLDVMEIHFQEDDRWERSSCSNGEYRTYTVTPRGHGNQSYSPNLARHQIRRRHHSQTSSPSR